MNRSLVCVMILAAIVGLLCAAPGRGLSPSGGCIICEAEGCELERGQHIHLVATTTELTCVVKSGQQAGQCSQTQREEYDVMENDGFRWYIAGNCFRKKCSTAVPTSQKCKLPKTPTAPVRPKPKPTPTGSGKPKFDAEACHGVAN